MVRAGPDWLPEILWVAFWTIYLHPMNPVFWVWFLFMEKYGE